MSTPSCLTQERGILGDRVFIGASRRGAAAVLIVAMMIVFVVLAAFTVDYAYMQLVRTELRIASDAASKAGAEALARTENVDFAKAEAIRYASLNTVGGTSYRISLDDVTVGRMVEGQGNSNRRGFVANQFPFNSVRVNARTGSGATHPAVPLFFGSVLGVNTFSPTQQSTAGQQQIEVCLCLDRSGSMLFDMSGVDWVYPPNNPLLSNFTAWGTMWQNHLSPPHPTASRWAVLRDAVQLFLDEAAGSNPQPRTSLVTWGSDYTMPVNPGTVFRAATLDVALPPQANFAFTANRQQVTNTVNQLGSRPMMGSTNLSAGLDLAVRQLTGTNAGSLSSKVVVLFTDGMWNDGRNPLLAAQDARNAGVTVHIVTMLTADQADLRQAAQLTGGRYYNAANASQLASAFREIAKSLQVVLID